MYSPVRATGAQRAINKEENPRIRIREYIFLLFSLLSLLFFTFPLFSFNFLYFYIIFLNLLLFFVRDMDCTVS